MIHGRRGTYIHRFCRCPRCTYAQRMYHRKYRARPSEEKDLTHGTVSSYVAGCRCDACRGANAAYYCEYRKRKRLKQKG